MSIYIAMFNKKFTGYESEATQLIHELRAKNPQLEAQQRAGRALLWDKQPIDLDRASREKASRIAQRPYVYQNL